MTGLGLWTPLGSDRESTWQSLLAGQSASRWLTGPQWTGTEALAGAPCASPHSAADVPRDPVMALALRVTTEATLDAALSASILGNERTGVVFGTSKGGLHTFSRLMESTRSARERRVPLSANKDWLDVWPDAAARAVARAFNCRGPLLCPVLACATGLAACQRAAELIRDGVCDVVLAGSADASLQPAILGSFRRLGVLARPSNDDAASACRPFDRDRTGFVIGEGAACLVFESLEHAQSRQASWYGEWLAGRILTDPSGLTQLDPSGTSLRRLLRDLSRDVPQRPDYINLHGTATIPNDRVESSAIRDLLASDASHVACSSLKGGLGHLLGAAGSVEMAATLLAIRDQIVPPTVNLFARDPDCDLDFTPREARPRRIDRAWKLSLGFGGHLSAACIGRLPGEGDRTRTH
ncbi:MAG: beta-ketoacyl-[acyl-carrier-protein] synthase family protein [Planctomycetota bacterium]